MRAAAVRGQATHRPKGQLRVQVRVRVRVQVQDQAGLQAQAAGRVGLADRPGSQGKGWQEAQVE